MKQLIVIDYGMGNIGSVVKKLRRIGCTPVVSSDKNDILQASKIILPGVGHFASGVEKLKLSGIWGALNEAVTGNKVPFLGICLGMQLMARFSEEGNEEGLDWINGEVLRMKVSDSKKYKIPHMGWNHVEVKKDSRLFKDVDLSTGFYFVHAYHFRCNDPSDTLCVTEYENSFVSAVEKDNCFGVQFHPEKSHDAGEQLLRNFINL